MIIERTHAAPTEVETASLAAHMRASSIFLNPNTTLWTSSHVFAQCEASKGPCLLIIALSALMPRLLALKASEVTAVLALDLNISLLKPCNIFFTLQIGTPEHFIVLVNLARQSQSFQSFVFVF